MSKRLTKTFLGYLLLLGTAYAQKTSVSATIVDPKGIPYSGGTVTVTLSAAERLNGSPYAPPSSISLDDGGGFFASLGDNNKLQPTGSTYTFVVCSSTSGLVPPFSATPTCFTASGITVTGVQMNLSVLINASATSIAPSAGVGGSCTNQVATAISSSAVPTCSTVTSAMVDASVAQTGTDINTSNQVTATHLASALPIAQGGTGSATGAVSGDLSGTLPSPTVAKVNGNTPGGSCTNQVATSIDSSGRPTCSTVTSAMVSNTIAQTGTDINTSNQVTATHLASALPVNQGGTGSTTGFTSSGVVGLFSTCSGTQYLGADGTCHAASGGLVLLCTLTASNSAELDFTASNCPNGALSSSYNDYEIHFHNTLSATNAVSLTLQFSSNGGSTWDTGANYEWGDHHIGFNGTAGDGSQSGGSAPFPSFIVVGVSGGGATGSSWGGQNGTVRLYNINLATWKQVTWNMFEGDGTNGSYTAVGGGGWHNTATTNVAFRFLYASGNIASGSVSLFGVTP